MVAKGCRSVVVFTVIVAVAQALGAFEGAAVVVLEVSGIVATVGSICTRLFRSWLLDTVRLLIVLSLDLSNNNGMSS